MNVVIITKCNECSESRPADSYGLGIYCDKLNQKISDNDECFIPDYCPKIISFDRSENGY